MSSDEVPKWLTDDLDKLNTSVQSTHDKLGTLLERLGEMRVKEATLQAKISALDRHGDDIETLKRQQSETQTALATLKEKVSVCEGTLQEVKQAQTDINKAVETAKTANVKLDTKITLYVSLISVVGAGIASIIVSLLTKYFGG